MAKDPAFLFYSQDFIVGVQTMTFDDRGKYITLLAQMHQQGRMDEKTIRFLVGSISDNLKNKFSIDKDGLWFNVRLEEETIKRNKFAESRRNNGKKGGRPKKETKPIPNLPDNHKVNLMEDEDEDENKDVSMGDARGSDADVTRSVVEANLSEITKQNRMANIMEELANSQVWFESVARATGLSETKTREKIKEFIDHIAATGEYCDPLSAIKRHCVNWIKKKKDEKNNIKKNNNEALKDFASHKFTSG